jgi:glycosyltransferase involved in cell wall biosynthesis
MATTLAVHRGTWHSVDRYIALTDAMAEHLRAFGVPADRITVKPNGIPDPGPSPSAPAPGGFLFAARLTPEKGLRLLLDAWRSHPVGALGTLRVAGDGPDRPLAEDAAAGRADVEYLGRLDPPGVRAAIGAAACVVVTPTWHDVLPTVVLEALAAGRPVLGTRMGGLPYLIGDEAGWVVEPDAASVATGLALAHAGATAAAPAARLRYERHFAPEVLTERLVEIYREVAKR